MVAVIFTLVNQAPRINPNSDASQQAVYQVVSEVRANLSTLVGHPVKFENLFSASSSSKNIRVSLVKELNLIFKAIKPDFKLEPRTQYCDPTVLNLPFAQKSDAITLIHWGMLPPTSAIVTSKSDALTIHQVGFVFGYFLSQIAYCTHMPDPKWSPQIEQP